MKFAPVTEKPKFTPITITLESEEEVAKLFAVLNYASLSKKLGFGDAYYFLKTANSEAGNDRIDYEKYHSALHQMLYRGV